MASDFDVIIIGSGVVGALMAYRLARAGVRVVILEAGDFVLDEPGRADLVRTFGRSPAKGQDAPYVEFVPSPTAPQPRDEPGEVPYYVQNPAVDPDLFKSFYERIVGGSMWHWQGICIRMIPSDFKLRSKFGRGFDWPISYADIEPWYCEAEKAMGVAGDDREAKDIYVRLLGAYRSQPFAMPAIVPSYSDKKFAAALNGGRFAYDGTQHEIQVSTVPHAANSQEYDGRPPCDGRGSCVPLCPTRAKYEATFHLERAIGNGAVLREKAIVTRLEAGSNGMITRVVYKSWDKAEHSETARVVVLAASGIESPKLLLLSNLANTSGKVGRYLMDHPIKASAGLARDPVYPFRGPQTTSDVATLRDGSFRTHRGAFKTSLKNDGWGGPTAAPRGLNYGKPADKGKLGTILDFVHNQEMFGNDLRTAITENVIRQITLNSAVEQLPIEDSRVTVDPTKLDETGVPRPKLHYLADDNRLYTRNSFRAVIAFHKWVFARMNATPVFLNDQELVDNTTPLNYLGSGHIMGTTLMGFDGKSSVVDKDCRAWDHKNLYIVGSSVFPTGSTANPTLTSAALALRAAKTIEVVLRQLPEKGA